MEGKEDAIQTLQLELLTKIRTLLKLCVLILYISDALDLYRA